MTYELPELGQPNITQDPKVRSALSVIRGLLFEGGLLRSNLAPESKPVTWYTPKVIATEQTRENTAFGLLGTADEIPGVVLPENGLIMVGYTGFMKSSVAAAGRAAIFVGSNQLKLQETSEIKEQEIGTSGTGFGWLSTSGAQGLARLGSELSAPPATTGQVLSGSGTAGGGGFTAIFAAAGTYSISVKYRATSGNVTAKERRLWVYTLGI